MFKTIAFGFAAALLAVSFGSAAQASLLGQTVTCSTSPLDCSSPTATVNDSGVPELQLQTGVQVPVFTITPVLDIDISSDGIVITGLSVLRVNLAAALTLGDLFWANDPNATIVGITNFVVSGVTGLTESDVTNGANSVTVDYGVTGWGIGSFVSFDLVTTHSDLPEPTTLSLVGIGMAGLGFAARRRRRDIVAP